jgi:S-(hydroxymethyl)glutathione dehydrogenase/alcohol dehydrogenase
VSGDTDAAVLTEIGAPLQLQRLAIPAPRHGQVVVDISWAALCHTQLNEIRGLKGPDPYLPHTLGHEGAGTVAAVGPSVSKVRPGDRVVLTWIRGAGIDAGGAIYQGPHGPVNSGPVSAFMRRAVVSENRVVPLADDMPLREASLLGCAIPTGLGLIRNEAGIAAGDSVAVFGVGGVGLAAVAGAVIARAATIVAIDLDDAKLERASRLGATHVVNLRRENLPAAIRRISAGRGLDAAVEAAGATEAMEAAFDSVRPGGVAVIAGNAPNDARIRIAPMDLIKGKRIVGSWGGGSEPDRDTPLYMTMYRQGGLPLAEMITHEYPLHMINEAFATLADRKAARVLIDMAEGAAPRTPGSRHG